MNEQYKAETATNRVDFDHIKAIHNDDKYRLAPVCNSSGASWFLCCVL